MTSEKKILLADDDKDDRFMFDHFFGELSADFMKLESVENGAEVIDFLDKIRDDGHLPHLIVLDQNMPKMSGTQTLSYLKSSDRYKNIPVIIYSTYNDQVFMQSCAALGASRIISKPDSYDGYKEMVRAFLNTL
jgi:CheY-like chemotaxis protein